MPRRLPEVSHPIDPRGERALDAALAASFPASDPVAALEPAPERPRRRRGSVRTGPSNDCSPTRKRDQP